MRVGMCGAGSTGKTTIAEQLSAKYSVPFLPSIVRSVMQDEWGLKTEMDAAALPAEERDQLQHMLFARRLHAERAMERFVSDRTVVDHAAYRLLHCELVEAELRLMMVQTGAAMRRLNLVFFFPIDGMPKVDDAFRNGTSDMRIAIDLSIKRLLDSLRIEHVVVPPGTRQERFAFVDGHVGQLDLLKAVQL